MANEISDEQLMLQYRDGDAAAFEILYNRHRSGLLRYIQHQCGNAAVAEELFQDVWMNLIKARERYEVKAKFSTFVYRMAHNRIIDHYRKEKNGVPASYDEHEGLLNDEATADIISPARKVEGMQQVDQLLAVVEDLPEAQREAFLLKEATGLSIEEIADMTGVNPETAKSRVRYALKKIRSSVEFEAYA